MGRQLGLSPLERERRPVARTAHLENEADVRRVEDNASVTKTPARRAPKSARLIKAGIALYAPRRRK